MIAHEQDVCPALLVEDRYRTRLVGADQGAIVIFRQ
jgi:hypothetical protein